MCRNYRTQRNVIERAKRDTPDVYAVFETIFGDRDLVGIVKVYAKTTADCYSVHRYGDTEPWAMDKPWNKPSNHTIAGWFGLDLRECTVCPV